MACREKETCILPEDDAHIVGKKIQDADALVIGTPTHWGNMCAPLKLLLTAMFQYSWEKALKVCQFQGRKGSVR
jgi:multimeric flavodoxin WrbA